MSSPPTQCWINPEPKHPEDHHSSFERTGWTRFVSTAPWLAIEKKLPEPVVRLLRYAGQTTRTARNPSITAREAIEVGNWIASRITDDPPVAYRHSDTHSLHHTEEEVVLADGDSHAEPLYLFGKPRWQPIATGPKDRPVLAWCNHKADPYWLDEGKSLTIYGGHAEGMTHAEDGLNIVEWGGAWDDRTHEEPNLDYAPDWWFVKGSFFECAANPTHWMEVPPDPV